MKVLFEDSDFLAVDKPAGVLCHASVDKDRTDVLSLTRKARPDLAELFLVHRLDAGTSGVLLFAKTAEAQTRITQAFRERAIKKTYLALCQGLPRRQKWTVENHLRERKDKGVTRMLAVHSGGDRAITDFQILESKRGRHLVVAAPRTGRRHQIRTHLADSLGGIDGDKTYGGAPASRMSLHAWRLSIPLENGQVQEIVAPIPKSFWNDWGEPSEPVAQKLRE